MPDPLSQLNTALEGRTVNEPQRIRDRAGDNSNALAQLLDAILGGARDNLGDAAGGVGGALGAVAGPIARAPGHLAGDLRGAFNAIPIVPNIGGGEDRGPGAAAGARRLGLAPLELAQALRAFALSRGRANFDGDWDPNKDPRNIPAKPNKIANDRAAGRR